MFWEEQPSFLCKRFPSMWFKPWAVKQIWSCWLNCPWWSFVIHKISIKTKMWKDVVEKCHESRVRGLPLRAFRMKCPGERRALPMSKAERQETALLGEGFVSLSSGPLLLKVQHLCTLQKSISQAKLKRENPGESGSLMSQALPSISWDESRDRFASLLYPPFSTTKQRERCNTLN